MKLYEIKESINTLLDYIEAEGANPEDFKLAIDMLEDELHEKVENIVKYIKNLDGDIAVFKSEEARLNERRKAMENKAKRLKDYLYDTMKGLNTSSMEAGTFKLRIQANPASVEILNEESIPENFKSYEVKIDKAGILSALKDGEVINGASIKQGEGLRIR